MHWTFEALAEMADALGKAEDAEHWRGIQGKLDDLLVDGQNVLMFAKREPFNVSHRHHSHTMAIHPLAKLTSKSRAVTVDGPSTCLTRGFLRSPLQMTFPH